MLGIRLPGVVHAKQFLRRSSTWVNIPGDVPKGYCAVYVGGDTHNIKRFVIPISYLTNPAFQDLLSRAEEEFGYDHPMGGLTIPCSEDVFLSLTSRMS
ncbi:hypothetical protein FNV43_RR22821 [Rhamnella rubrinervis]|uniref:Uncharacterized protein n=1 Tax=Rhamnella rubrinervis TaxID=2594499 RepID=A0A8K0GRH0_9ROSA|nr:hypothetical protein FNV43_RR22821 [Rhamnella rubrinervis]